ncbi:MAG: ABC transporter ATP-binding protein [Ruminococcaceae bacterium]|nr:ABC transporter ATP-binding protein [Oscillospiraceae bacterium]
MEILTIKGLEKSFGDKKVLSSLDMSVPEHSIFGFVGRNGAGKTTTMKAVLGLLKTDGGEIHVAGERVRYGETATNRHIGYLPDVPEFYSFMNAREYLKLCGESLGMKNADIKQRSDELLLLVGLAEETHRIKGYSRGMKQRLGIAQALLSRPKLLICDEPTSALDPIGRKDILDILLSVREQTTVLFSTHILSDVERICTDVALLNEGKIAMQGSIDEIRRIQRQEEFTVELLDERSAQLLQNAFGDVQRTSADTLVFRGGEERMFEFLGFIKENRLALQKIERSGSSLESLFMEVVGK